MVKMYFWDSSALPEKYKVQGQEGYYQISSSV